MRIKEKHLIIANFKMYLSGKGQVSQWLRNFDRDSKNLELIESRLVLCPPAVSLADFASNIELDCVSFGAQDCFWQDEGAYTSGLGSKMVSSYGGKFVILGHSERRKYFGETDEAVSHKTSLAVKNRLHPILCVGENADEKRREETKEVLLNKLEKNLQFIGKGTIEEVVICYEPIWAISANNPDHLPTANELMEARVLIKKFLVGKYGQSAAERVRIIYGGSVDSKNYREVCVESGMEGALIGGASKMPYELVKIAKIAEEGK